MGEAGEHRISLTIGTAGHVDHGKTTLVKYMTGTDTDRLEEEHRRGISIVPGYAELQIGGDEVVGRDDDVVARGPGPHLGQQIVVGGVHVVVDAQVGQGLEQRDAAVIDVVRPVVDVEQPVVGVARGRLAVAGGRGGRRLVVVVPPGHGPAGVPGAPGRDQQAGHLEEAPPTDPPVGWRHEHVQLRVSLAGTHHDSLSPPAVFPDCYPRRTTTSSTSSASPGGASSATISSFSGPPARAVWSTMTRFQTTPGRVVAVAFETSRPSPPTSRRVTCWPGAVERTQAEAT